MAMVSPTESKRVVDPDTEDIDGLALIAAAELRENGEDIEPAALARRLGIPAESVGRQWDRLRTCLQAQP